jgi:hypothetical protein
MTITYPNGETLQALLLSRGEDTLRTAIAGGDDVRIFKLIHDQWISEEWEPVQIDFAWSRCGSSNVPSEADCICPKDLASRLMSMLFSGPGGDDALDDILWVFSASTSNDTDSKLAN